MSSATNNGADRFYRPLRESDSDANSVSGDDEDDMNELTLTTGPEQRKINLGIRATYTNWGPVEAFREIVQNWRDAIIRSFHLTEEEFVVTREERSYKKDVNILYKATLTKSTPTRELGYIRFYGKDEGGWVDVVNRCSTLERSHLYIGGTDKTGIRNQAGAHGEGLKIALLVFQRGGQNHSVKCVSGSHSFSFNFTKAGILVAHVRRLSPKQIADREAEARKEVEKGLVPFAASPKDDVRFLIGLRCAGRDENGNKGKRVPVRLKSFKDWCESALFLQNVDAGEGEGIIRTHRGDLIIDPRLCGNIYLKGLLLKKSTGSKSASITEKKLKFGYNFQEGKTNRERQQLTKPSEKCSSILGIWEQVLAKKSHYVSKLNDMLLSSEPGYADVWAAKDYIKLQVAFRLKNYLLSDSEAWYYSAKEKSENRLLEKIIQGLGRKGIELPESYWCIFAKYDLLRTAEQEQRKRFLNSDPDRTPTTLFGHEFHRLIQACMRSCPQTADMSTQFVRAGELSLDVFYHTEKRLFKIHNKWLNCEEATQALGLPSNLTEIGILFHSVKMLFAEILDEIPIDTFNENDDRSNIWRKRQQLIRSEQRLLDYLQIKKSLALEQCVIASHSDASVRLKWNSNNSLSEDTELTIQLHDENCSMIPENHLIAGELGPSGAPCISKDPSPHAAASYLLNECDDEQCLEILCKHRTGSCQFDRLKLGRNYFALMFQSSNPDSIILKSNHCRAVQISPPPRPESPIENLLDEPNSVMETPPSLSERYLTRSSPQLRAAHGHRTKRDVTASVLNETGTDLSEGGDDAMDLSKTFSLERDGTPSCSPSMFGTMYTSKLQVDMIQEPGDLMPLNSSRGSAPFVGYFGTARLV
ncbi:hypothetical protein BGZ63DRAFT_426122 [Mariannaea sp. PMI_226]|nr:hypothetical protein BGZ63DRAFT_426122 [Mariannaea sp. PMI_226]